jgi:hypothetical protein
MNASSHLTLLGLLCATTLGGCALPTVKALPADATTVDANPTSTAHSEQLSTSAVASTQPAWAENGNRQQPLLYARDGSVVSEQRPGTVSITEDPGQAAGADTGSRWTLLEQYQASIQRSEDLEFEIRGLTKDLEAAEAREQQLAAELGALNAQMAKMIEKLELVQDQNIDLASRLTTAQIRRLQSEKLLLEAKLDGRRVEETLNAAELKEEAGTEAGQTPAEPKIESTAVGSK